MKTVSLQLSDEILAGIVREQLSRLSSVAIVEKEADLVITSSALKSDIPQLAIGTGGMSLPLRLGELSDRVLYLLSGRDRFANDSEIEFAGFTLQSEDGMMRDGQGRSIRLTDKEKLIILSLYDAPDHALDRRELLQQVWGYAETAETHTLETHLYRLRQKIEENFGVTDLILTKDGIYSLKI